MGDSIQRCAYKDLVTLLQRDSLVGHDAFKKVAERSHDNDELVGVTEEKSNSAAFFQIRSYYHKKSNTRLVYYFMTKIFSGYCQYIFENDFGKDINKRPDLIIANSMLYDISEHHYGKKAGSNYLKNINTFFKTCDFYGIPVVWRSSLPLGKNAKGGVMKPFKDVHTNTGHVRQVRNDIVESNEKVKQYCLENGYPFLDVHDHFATILEEREGDDIHWSPFSHRLLTYMTLSFVRRAIINVPRIPWVFDPKMVQHDAESIEIAKYVVENMESFRDLQGENYFQTASVKVKLSRPDENMVKRIGEKRAAGNLKKCSKKSEILRSIVFEQPLELR